MSGFKPRLASKIQQATLCFLQRNSGGKRQILLAMKKRGFGQGKWNGVGGKVANGETVKKTAVREAKEEIGVDLKNLVKVALVHFYFPDDPEKAGWNQDVHVFHSNSWTGKPTESEEMKPRWFGIDRVPYKKMWDDDKLWLPEVLKGRVIEAFFEFDDNNKTIRRKIINAKF